MKKKLPKSAKMPLITLLVPILHNPIRFVCVQNVQKATNVFAQKHSVSRENRGAVLGNSGSEFRYYCLMAGRYELCPLINTINIT